MDVDALLTSLAEAAAGRLASALVADDEHTLEVSVAGADRWVVRSWNREWTGGPDGVRCWHLIPAGGAAEVPSGRPDGWVHPVVGMLRPDLLPVWGRGEDDYEPIRVVEGLFGPAQVVLGRVGDDEAVGTLHLDARRWLCTALELPGQSWTMTQFTSP